MAVGKKTDEKILDKMLLTDDDLVYLHRQDIHKRALSLYAVVQFFNVYALHKYDF